jgi:hypothetical protein
VGVELAFLALGEDKLYILLRAHLLSQYNIISPNYLRDGQARAVASPNFEGREGRKGGRGSGGKRGRGKGSEGWHASRNGTTCSLLSIYSSTVVL